MMGAIIMKKSKLKEYSYTFILLGVLLVVIFNLFSARKHITAHLY